MKKNMRKKTRSEHRGFRSYFNQCDVVACLQCQFMVWLFYSLALYRLVSGVVGLFLDFVPVYQCIGEMKQPVPSLYIARKCYKYFPLIFSR